MCELLHGDTALIIFSARSSFQFQPCSGSSRAARPPLRSAPHRSRAPQDESSIGGCLRSEVQRRRRATQHVGNSSPPSPSRTSSRETAVQRLREADSRSRAAVGRGRAPSPLPSGSGQPLPCAPLRSRDPPPPARPPPGPRRAAPPRTGWCRRLPGPGSRGRAAAGRGGGGGRRRLAAAAPAPPAWPRAERPPRQPAGRAPGGRDGEAAKRCKRGICEVGGRGKETNNNQKKKEKKKIPRLRKAAGAAGLQGLLRARRCARCRRCSPSPSSTRSRQRGSTSREGTPPRCQSRPGRIAPLPPARGWRSHSPQCPPGANLAQHPGSPTPSPSSASLGGGLSRLAGSDCQQL